GPGPHLAAVRAAGLGEVAAPDLRPLLAQLASEQATVVRQAAGDADRRVPGERSQLERPPRPDPPHQQRDQRALVGSDLHHGDVAERRRLIGEAPQDVVLAGAVLDQVAVQLVVERGVLRSHRDVYSERGPAAYAANPAPSPTSAPPRPAQALAKSSTKGSASSTAAQTVTPMTS